MLRMPVVPVLLLVAGLTACDAAPRNSDAQVVVKADTVVSRTLTEDLPTNPPEGARDMLRQFRDPTGQQPLALYVLAGRRAHATYLDSTLFRLPIPEQLKRAQTAARQVWIQVGQVEGVDTITVRYVNQTKIDPNRKERTFFIYARDLTAPARP